eukprot:1837656-Prymnesium_polylepis.1
MRASRGRCVSVHARPMRVRCAPGACARATTSAAGGDPREDHARRRARQGPRDAAGAGAEGPRGGAHLAARARD